VVGPLELFCDLAVVVVVAQAARHLAGHLTWRGLGQFAAVFTLVWIAWTNGSLHAASPRAHPTLSSGFPRRPAPAAPAGRLAPRRARAPC